MNRHPSRREFIRESGLWIAGATFLPSILYRGIVTAVAAPSPFAGNAASGKKFLVVIIQRGAMDGLSLVAPIEDPDYRSARSEISIVGSGDLAPMALGNGFHLHPSFRALAPYWNEGTLLFAHQSGSANPTRSHFDAQDYFEVGTPNSKSTPDGFLNRALRSIDSASLFTGIALQPSMPRILQGPRSALALESIENYQIAAPAAGDPTAGFESLYAHAADSVFRGVGSEMSDSLKQMKDLRQKARMKKGGYPKSALGRRLAEIATLVQSDLGVRVAVTDTGGWDTHINQGNPAKGALTDRLREVSEGLAAFAKDLGPRFADATVVCVTEFGRTVRQNGTRGTDHGHGSVMTLLGGGLAGKRILAPPTSLKAADLHEGRDLKVELDHRDVFAEILGHHLGIKSMNTIFPGWSPKRGGLPKLFRT